MADSKTTGQIQEFLLVLRRRRWQIVLPALFVLTFGAVFAVIVPKKYVVSTEVEVLEGPRSNLDPKLQNPKGPHALREIANVLSHVKQHKRIKEVVEDQGDLWGEYVKLDDRERSDYIEQIRARVMVDPPRKSSSEGSEFVGVRYSDVDGQRAELFLEALVKSWIDYLTTWDKQDLMSERDALQELVTEGSKEYDAKNGAYTKLAREMEIDPNAPLLDNRNASGDSVIGRRDTVAGELDRVRVEIEAAQAAFDQAEKERKEAPPTIAEEIEEGGVTYRAEIAKWEHQIQSFLLQMQSYTPENSKYRRIEHEIHKLEIQIEQAKSLNIDPSVRVDRKANPILVDLDRTVVEARGRLVELRGRRQALADQKTVLEGKARTRIGQYQDLRDLHQDRVLLRLLLDEHVAELSRKKSTLSILEDAYAEPYRIVKPAIAGDKPEAPNPWIIVIASALAGIGAGLGLAMLLEYARNSFRTASDVAHQLAVPVLGAIDSIVTTAQARRAQLRRAVVGISSAVIMGGLAWFTWIWASAPERLPTEIRQAIDEFRRTLM